MIFAEFSLNKFSSRNNFNVSANTSWNLRCIHITLSIKHSAFNPRITQHQRIATYILPHCPHFSFSLRRGAWKMLNLVFTEISFKAAIFSFADEKKSTFCCCAVNRKKWERKKKSFKVCFLINRGVQ